MRENLSLDQKGTPTSARHIYGIILQRHTAGNRVFRALFFKRNKERDLSFHIRNGSHIIKRYCNSLNPLIQILIPEYQRNIAINLRITVNIQRNFPAQKNSGIQVDKIMALYRNLYRFPIKFMRESRRLKASPPPMPPRTRPQPGRLSAWMR